MTDKLLPCPFCSSDAKLRIGNNPTAWMMVICIKCGSGTMLYKTSDEAIDAWNTRPQQVEDYRYHVDCDDFNHQCTTCKHNEDCAFNCSACNVNSAVCFYELDDEPQPTLMDIADLIEMVDARLDYLTELIKAKKAKK